MTTLQAGDPAPAFSGKDESGKTRSLKSFKGKKLVLYFYPKDDTPACTAQACNLRDNYAVLRKAGYHILGISPDAGKRHLKFIDKYSLPFPLLADEDHKIAEAYGVWGPKQFMGRHYIGLHRTTFVIDKNGIIEKVITRVITRKHVEQILA